MSAKGGDGFTQTAFIQILSEPESFKDARISLRVLKVNPPIFLQGKLIASSRKVPQKPVELATEDKPYKSKEGETQILLVSGEICPLPVFINPDHLIGKCFAIYISRDKQHRGVSGWTSAVVIQHQSELVTDTEGGGDFLMSSIFAGIVGSTANVAEESLRDRWDALEVEPTVGINDIAANNAQRAYTATKLNLSAGTAIGIVQQLPRGTSFAIPDSRILISILSSMTLGNGFLLEVSLVR